MQFSRRMSYFGENIFTTLLNMKKELEAGGTEVIDLSVGTPNIPPAPHVIEALVEAAKDEKNYVYAIKDLDELHEAVAVWYKRRYHVDVDPENEVVSLLGSQEAHLVIQGRDTYELLW